MNTEEGDLDWEDIQRCAWLLKFLAVPTRLESLLQVALCPACVKEIAARTSLDDSLLSHNLGGLAQRGLVRFTPRGSHHVYTVSEIVTADCSAGWLSVSVHADRFEASMRVRLRSARVITSGDRAAGDGEPEPAGAVRAPRAGARKSSRRPRRS